MRIEILDPERAMSLRSEDGAWVWSFALVPHNGSSRLISRNRARVCTTSERVGMAAMEIRSLVMERKMCTGSSIGPKGGAAGNAHAPSNHT